MTVATNKGFKLGEIYIITAEHDCAGKHPHIGPHDFSVGEEVKFASDDNSDCPLFASVSTGKKAYVKLDCLKDGKAGPAYGVLYSDAPAGATHYSGKEGHTDKWHKLEGGKWYFYQTVEASWFSSGTNFTPKWKEYSSPEYAYPDLQMEIPAEHLKLEVKVEPVTQSKSAEIRADLAAIEKRLTRTGSKMGRAHKRLEEVKARFKEQGEQKDELERQLVEALKAEEKAANPIHSAKRGDKVVSVTDDRAADIQVGKVYTLTADVFEGVIHFKDDKGHERTRIARNYRLATPQDGLVKITDAKELVELMHNAAKWKAGMTVIARTEPEYAMDIDNGEKFVLTKDARVRGSDAEGKPLVTLFFKDRNGLDRERTAHKYQLVTKDLV